jgi:hypothetical protein
MTARRTKSFSGTLNAGVGGLMAPAFGDGTLLIVANNGVNSMTVKFGSAPLSATDGFVLDAASTSGGQGGSMVLTIGDALDGAFVPVDAIYGLSTLGTTFGVVRQDGESQVTPYLNKHGYA